MVVSSALLFRLPITQVSYQKEQLVIQRYHRRKPTDLPQLESLLAERLRPVHLLDVLTDTEFWLNWTRFFKPISGYEAKLDDLLLWL
jgi:hypothetical protein